MVGWGQAGYLSEVEPDGRVLFNAHLPPGWESYRAYALPWSARPAVPPAVAVQTPAGQGQPVVYASWNGATDVAGWRVLLDEEPQGGGVGSEDGVRDGAGPASGRERALRGRAGHGQLRCGHRCLRRGEGLSAPVAGHPWWGTWWESFPTTRSERSLRRTAAAVAAFLAVAK
jgi:hypothetical protein